MPSKKKKAMSVDLNVQKPTSIYLIIILQKLYKDNYKMHIIKQQCIKNKLLLLKLNNKVNPLIKNIKIFKIKSLLKIIKLIKFKRNLKLLKMSKRCNKKLLFMICRIKILKINLDSIKDNLNKVNKSSNKLLKRQESDNNNIKNNKHTKLHYKQN